MTLLKPIHCAATRGAMKDAMDSHQSMMLKGQPTPMTEREEIEAELSYVKSQAENTRSLPPHDTLRYMWESREAALRAWLADKSQRKR